MLFLIGDGAYLWDWHSGPSTFADVLSKAFTHALLGAPFLPTYFYIPIMIVLFVFWFTDTRER